MGELRHAGLDPASSVLLDSGLRRHDEKWYFLAFYGTINP